MSKHGLVLVRTPTVLALILCVLFIDRSIAAQQPNTRPGGDGMSSSRSAATMTPNEKEQYLIGAGDELEIRFYNRPQLSGIVRVSMRGTIRLPLVEEDVSAACKTEDQLSKDIAKLYLKYLRNPYVTVLVKEFDSTPVAVVGAVDKPGRFQLTRRTRLLELLAYAGGPTEKAGGQIVVAHIDGMSVCASSDPQNANATTDAFITYSLKETLHGEEKANPWVEPGDMISITEADQAYVVGNVFKPQPVPLKDPVTVSQAIAMAGGTLPATKNSTIRVFRRLPGSSEQELIVVDLAAIKQRKAEDPLLQANDIVDVPSSTTKKAFTSVLNALGAGMQSVPYIVLRR